MAGRRLGRRFGWLWAAYSVSTFGSFFAFDAVTVVAVIVLHAAAVEVSVLAAAGPAVGALLAVLLGPWVEFHRKRPVMVAADLARFVAVLSVPVAYLLGVLGLAQLVAVSVLVGTADLAFTAASGACLKGLVTGDDLLVANGRFESTTWTSVLLGPPLGGAAIGLFGPVTSMTVDAVSYLLSAVGIRAIGGDEPRPARRGSAPGGLLEGWRHIAGHPTLRPLFLNTVLVNGLIMAPAPLVAVLMLGELEFAPWQYGLAFAVPCVGGLLGARLSGPLVTRFGSRRVMAAAGSLRACWPVGLAFVGPGVGGLVLVMAVQFGLITCIAVFNPVYATHRLEGTGPDRVSRVLSAWSVSSRAATAALTLLWGLLAAVTSPRAAIAVAGVLLLATPLLLPGRERQTGQLSCR